MGKSYLLTNAVVLLLLAGAALLSETHDDFYYRLVQEDGLLEWATFWAFIAGTGYFWREALGQRRAGTRLPWFATGLGLFCLLVAMEEISWGQRLFAYQPPEYFLAANYQQELNLHNVVDTGIRKLLMQAILLGYGVIASAAVLVAPLQKGLDRAGIIVPPPQLIPAFVVMAVVYDTYPLRFTGEWIELTLGFTFLFFAASLPAAERGLAKTVGWPAGAVLALAAATVLAFDLLRPSDEERIAATQRELAALARDFNDPRVASRCGLHKRLYTFMRDYEQPYLREGRFASLLREAGDTTRADYLLDPWNSPYWLRHKCSRGREALFVYSLGPDRQRSSTEWQVEGDDIGAQISGTPAPRD